MSLLTRLQPPGGDRTLQAGLMVLLGAGLLVHCLLRQAWEAAVPSAGMIACGAGLWRLRLWALHLTLLLAAVMLLLQLLPLTDGTWEIRHGIFAVLTVWFAWNIWRDFKPHVSPARGAKPAPTAADENNGPAASLVWLLRSPLQLTPQLVARAAEAAWGGSYRAVEQSRIGDAADDNGSTGLVSGNEQLMLIRGPAAVFSVISLPKPYLPEREKAAASIAGAADADAVRRHAAWCSCDLNAVLDETRGRDSFYMEIGSLIAELADPDNCLALIDPRTRRITAWDDGMPSRLRSQSPLTALDGPPSDDGGGHSADDGHEAMLAAINEARRRWPEFVNAFNHRAGKGFTVKALMQAGGHREFVWIDVEALHEEFLRGRLSTEPVSLGPLALGSGVEVPLQDVMDWCFEAGGDLHGLFTPQALARLKKQA